MPSACVQGEARPLSIGYHTCQRHVPTSVRFPYYIDIMFIGFLDYDAKLDIAQGDNYAQDD